VDFSGQFAKLSMDSFSSGGYKKATPFKGKIGEAVLANIDATAQNDAKEILHVLEELKNAVQKKETKTQVYQKIAYKFVSYGSWDKLILDLLQYTGHI
jgi:hypothetical protein